MDIKRRFWECECCGSLLVTLPQDSAEDYKCPQCRKVKCDHGGKYVEVSAEYFAREAGLVVPNAEVTGA
jgi:hypothetical protein